MEIKGSCPVYKVGDKMTLEGFYIISGGSANICIHALTAMMSADASNDKAHASNDKPSLIHRSNGNPSLD